MLANGNLIERLRVRNAVSDPLLARLRISSVLGAMDFRPPGVPETAIVFIRTLRDPLPGRWRLGGVGAPPPGVWRQAVSQAVADSARRAARPARDVVSGESAAVYFADQGELLACLARDWCEGVAGTRWWWRTLLRDRDVERAVLEHWRANVEYTPGALQQLAESGHVVTFVGRLAPAAVRDLLFALVERFGLMSLKETLDVGECDTRSDDDADFHPLSASPASSRSDRIASRVNPFRHRVREVDEPLTSPERSVFLGIGLMLQRAPAEIRSRVFAEQVVRWMGRDSLAADEAVSASANFGRAHGPERNTPQPIPRNPAAATISGELAPAPNMPAAKASAKSPGSPQKPATEVDWQDFGIDQKDGARSENGESARNSVEAEGTASVSRIAPGHATVDDLGPVTASVSSVDEVWVESAQGGALFFINLALFLGLYGDFTTPERPGLDLPIWDFVALMGDARTGPDFRDDPLWPLLAQLAGRETTEEPGAHFMPPPDWRMPAEWLAPFASAVPWTWTAGSGRLTVSHPAGFVVIDIPHSGRASRAVLARELVPYRAAKVAFGLVRRRIEKPSIGAASPPPDSSGRRRWFDRLLPYIDARLASALAGAGDAARYLRALPARVRVTGTHLDAYFELARLPIEIRLAGLDRNPGWVPAAGRYVTFHFD